MKYAEDIDMAGECNCFNSFNGKKIESKSSAFEITSYKIMLLPYH